MPTPTLRRRLAGPPAPTPGSRPGQGGQALVIFTVALVAMVSVAGLLIDGGMAWANRRQAQAAADTAALAAAQGYAAASDATAARAAAESLAAANGFPRTFTTCTGRTSSDGIKVNIPPTAGAYAGKSGYVEIVVMRAMRTSFSGLVGQPCWLVSARAVAIATTSEVANCNFCSLNNSGSNHTLLLKNGATLRVDGDIHANSKNGGTTPGVCLVKDWKVCGDGFDVFGEGGRISAKHITVVGGWETHDGNIATADALAPGCTETYTPLKQTQASNVCIHMPEIPDPFNDPAKPAARLDPPTPGAGPQPGAGGCPSDAVAPAGSSEKAALTTIDRGIRTICPGTYYGGIQIRGGSVTMLPGTYIMAGGGFSVIDSANLDGRAGVTIYSTGSSGAGHSVNQGQSLVPDPVLGKLNFAEVSMSSTKASANTGEVVTFKLTLKPVSTAHPVPTGHVDFYDGNVMICSASPLVVQKGNVVAGSCTTSFDIWGTRSIAAVYSGDTAYNAAGTSLNIVVKAPSGIKDGPIEITTDGRVDLHGPTTGRYAGLTLFQDVSSNMTMTLSPGRSSRGGCKGGFMTAGVPPDTSPPPDPCGAIGGLQGTVYSPNHRALVLITASGMANLQVIAGEIQVTSDADARFGFKPEVFANSSIHLVE